MVLCVVMGVVMAYLDTPPLAGDPLAWIPGWSLRSYSRVGDALGPGTAAVPLLLGGL